MRHSGAFFPYRHLPPEGVIEKTLSAVGGAFRALGETLDHVGAIIQGPGAQKDSVQPNLAFAPTLPDPSNPPTRGQLVKVPAITRVPPLKEIVMPQKGHGAFIAPNANVMGDVKLGSNTSIWYGACLRGDVNAIEVGNNTNVQDNVVIHTARHTVDGKPRATIIGNNVTIGHGATVHACTIKDNSLIGMGATVLDGSVVEEGSIVAAGAVVPPNTHIPSGQVWAGNPARKLRDLEQDELAFIKASAANYAQLADLHKFENSKTFEELAVEGAIEVDRWYASDPLNSVHQMWLLDRQTLIPVAPKK